MMSGMLINYLLESTLCLSVFYLFYYILLKNERSFRFNRYYLLITPALSILLPLINIPIFRPQDPTPMDILFELPIVVTEVTKVVEPLEVTPIWVSWILFIYITGISFLAIRFLLRLLQLRQLASHASDVRIINGIKVIISPEDHPVFAFDNKIFVSQKIFHSPDFQQILIHEEAHILQGHTRDIVLFEIMIALMWFNPLVYRMKSDVRENHEYLADEYATRDKNKLEYVLTLLRQLAGTDVNSLSHHFSMKLTKKRIRMIRSNRKPSQWTLLSVLPFLVFVVFIFSCTSQFEEEDSFITTETKRPVPEDFATIISQLETQNPDKRYYFNITDDIDLALTKDSKTEGYEIVYYSKIEDLGKLISPNGSLTINYEGYEEPNPQFYGLVVEFYKDPKSFKPDGLDLDTDIYTAKQVDLVPEPWYNMDQIIYSIHKNFKRPDLPGAEKVHGKIKLSFVVNMYGSVIYTKPVSGLEFVNKELRWRLYGAAVNAVTATSKYWKPGEKNGKQVSVKQEITIEI